ncbi:MAG: DUF4250 domain-containing protein [Lachnospiraceae bacterium]|jgi:hypothetical protein|nr:DUF4250 domain-containing protein [Lachnospiraceae bacterium]
MIPEDPFILLSFINMKLRDEYDSLDALADGLDVDVNDIKSRLDSVGFKYDASQNQFK